ncbi:unnamed protein product [Parascedosporium putredinis]|uniref:Nucleoside phosphorylase domain-containing protein n=1 Tax=Parascedosporium putredinis TaxID=1442378 RepID=A0A9P1HC77_9PEZI|nr:unnamed protein product [Parascedosporium putredinis]CAI8002816.1 unnamed protein product [Parascedosporium putredinis]
MDLSQLEEMLQFAKTSFIIPVSTMCDEFKYAIVCALPIEFDAVLLALDEWYNGPIGQHKQDRNSYTTGQIDNINIVVAIGEKGNTSAACVASDMRVSFENLLLTLVVGVCGGVPLACQDEEMILGDVVISNSINQYDFGKLRGDGEIQAYSGTKDFTTKLNQRYRSILRHMDTYHARVELETKVATRLQWIQGKIAPERKLAKAYQYPGAANDRLYEAAYEHKHRGSPDCICSSELKICEASQKMSCLNLGCDEGRLVSRMRLDDIQKLERSDNQKQEAQARSIIVGMVGSANSLVISSKHRDALVQQGIVAVEMEGAGVGHDTQTIIVKGVSDYADSHKNKDWQGFASIQAASVARELLIFVERQNQAGQAEGEIPTAYNSYSKDYATRLLRELEPNYPTVFEAANRMALCLYKYPDQQSRPLLPSDKPHQELEDHELDSLQNAQDFSVASEPYAGDRRRLIIQARLTRFIIDVRMEEKKSPGEVGLWSKTQARR